MMNNIRERLWREYLISSPDVSSSGQPEPERLRHVFDSAPRSFSLHTSCRVLSGKLLKGEKFSIENSLRPLTWDSPVPYQFCEWIFDIFLHFPNIIVASVFKVWVAWWPGRLPAIPAGLVAAPSDAETARAAAPPVSCLLSCPCN